ncbi:MAG: S8 family serine peptidase [Candidatus Thermoplasmatota archaeon]|nr:S8 family serine peptidase [Candidatus Thermoplasmatota archaeon]
MDTPRTLLIALTLMTATFALAPGQAQSAPAPYDAHLEEALAQGMDPVKVIALTDGAADPVATQARLEGAQVTWTYDIVDGFAATVPRAQLEDVARLPGVESLHLDREVTTVMDTSSRAIEADKAWATGLDGSGITVAVIDTGIEVTHPFFAGAIVSCVSTISGVVSPECTDSDGHGTHVAGTVASRDETYPGIAPGASLAAVRVLHAAGAGTSSDIIAGMEWVQENKDLTVPPIRVATMSIGFVDPGCGDGTGPEAQAADALVESGVFFSVAAGNAGHDSCTIDGASAAEKVTTIGAVDDQDTITQQDDVIADFSSGGPTADGRLKPDVTFPGVGITSAYIGGGVLVATLDGTSMATPHAAGTAALMFQQDPSRSAQNVKDTMLNTAIKTANTGSTANAIYGHGLGNACEALGLQGCSELAPPPEPTEVHVDDVTLTSEVKGKDQVRVTTTATILDDQGEPVQDAAVSFTVTSPSGDTHTGTATTDSQGQASYTAREKGGSGTWEGCVDDVTGTNLAYVPSQNAETCDTTTA